MSRKKIMSLGERIEAAFQEVEADVIRRAKQFGTRIVLWEKGQMLSLTWQEWEARRKRAAQKKNDKATKSAIRKASSEPEA
jgi:hypothetical protein